MRGTWIGRLARKPSLEQCGDPRRAIAERFNLLILDKNGVAANPVVAADRAVYQFCCIGVLSSLPFSAA